VGRKSKAEEKNGLRIEWISRPDQKIDEAGERIARPNGRNSRARERKAWTADRFIEPGSRMWRPEGG
jgi:hypothetical protein